MNFHIDCVAYARNECARCGDPWLHPEWGFLQSHPVAFIQTHLDDMREVWCDRCVLK